MYMSETDLICRMSLRADIAQVPFGTVLTELSRNQRRRAIQQKIVQFRGKQVTQMPGLSRGSPA